MSMGLWSVIRGPWSASVVAACCLIGFVAFRSDRQRTTDNKPVFILETIAGERLRGPLAQLREDWSVRLGPPSPRSRDGDAWLTLRRADLPPPPHPSEAQVLLTNGDRL